MSLVKSAVRIGLHRTGAIGLVREMRRSGIRILTYHRFHDRQAWDAQCRHLRRHYQPVSLSQVADSFRSGSPLPSKAVAVTVDDGYRDFYTEAFPIAAQYSIPVTVFLVTDFLDSGWLWRDVVEYVLRNTPADRQRSARDLIDTLKTWPDSKRRDFLAALPESFKVTLPEHPPEDAAPLTWDQVREMRRAGIEFGAHTKTHPILPRVESADVLAEEITQPKRRIEQELNEPVRFFCYPNGEWDQRSVECVRQSGYELAVTMDWGRNVAPRSPLLLQRSPADPSWPTLFFREVVAFGHPWRRQTLQEPA